LSQNFGVVTQGRGTIMHWSFFQFSKLTKNKVQDNYTSFRR